MSFSLICRWNGYVSPICALGWNNQNYMFFLGKVGVNQIEAAYKHIVKTNSRFCVWNFCWVLLNINIFLLFQNASAQAALQAAQALSGHTETQGGPNTVLRVVIEHMLYPVTLEVLYQVSDAKLIHIHILKLVNIRLWQFLIWGRKGPEREERGLLRLPCLTTPVWILLEEGWILFRGVLTE